MSTFERIQKLIAETLGVDASEVTQNSHLYDDLKLDSLDQLELIIQLEVEFDLFITDEEAASWKTVADVVAYIDNRKP